MGYWARRFYERLSNRQIDMIFDIIESNGIIDALLKADDLPFDWHGEAMVRLLGRGAIAKVIRVIKKRAPRISGGSPGYPSSHNQG